MLVEAIRKLYIWLQTNRMEALHQFWLDVEVECYFKKKDCPFYAGRDTTATTLSWFTYLLTNNPDVADKIYKEVLVLEEHEDDNYRSLPLGEKMKHYASLCTYDVLSKLPYLHAAITETMRLYPAVPQVPSLPHQCP